ncbi:MAG: leucine-rich repeat domain-containing protein [Spirochaetaceae bacterium]|nr:leucine-rich repeat domain-containing protein [Spirochaetaceae bacterium]
MNNIKNNEYIVGIILPSSLTAIGGHAFNGCASLTSVTFECDLVRATFGGGTYESFPGDLREKYLAAQNGGAGTYTRPGTESDTWTKQPAD